ncbi:MAG: choice-of-anchor D domain-containing protein [Bacteroidota bacterium]
MKSKCFPSVLFFCFLLLGISIPDKVFSQWEKQPLGVGAGGSIAYDAEGDIHLCYLTGPYEGDLVYALQQENQWARDTIVRSGIVIQCKLVVDEGGKLHLAYVEADWYANEFTLKYVFNEGTGWSSPDAITSDNLGISSLSFDVDTAGYLHLGYIQTNSIGSPGPLIYFHNSSGTWQEEAVSVHYDDYAYSDASLAVDDNGYVHFAFYNMPDGPVYQTNVPDGNWSDLIPVQNNWTGGQMEGMVIDIAVDSEGTPNVSYVGSDNGEPYENHRYATKSGTDWVTEQVDDGSEYSGAHAITVDTAGKSQIVYYHMASNELRYAYYNGTWSHETLDVCESTEGSVDIIVDAEGYAHICYQADPEHIWYVTNNVEMPAPQIVLSHDTLSFGVIDTGYVTIDSLYILNDGVVDLHITDIQLSGADSAEFSIEHSCGTIEPGDSCKVRLTFAPDSPGSKQVTLEITSDDPETPVAEAVITGRTPAPVIRATPDELVFELTEVGATDTRWLTIKNAGDRDLEIYSFELFGDNSGEFDYQSACGTISPDDSCDIEVIFLPASQGTKTATLVIYSNDPDNPEATVTLEGRTPGPHIESPNEVLDFGIVPVGSLVTEQLIIENTGERQLNISDLSITGMNESLFHASNTCGAISPEGFCYLNVTFRPMSTGPKNAELTITSNDPDQSVFSVRLRGSGGKGYSNAFTYGTEGDERFLCMDDLSAGGSVVGGRSAGYAYLAAISPTGDFIWQKKYSTGAYGDAIYSVKELWDGGFIVAGTLHWRYRWIARLNSQGEVLWDKKPEFDYGGKIYDIKITSGLDFIAVGETVPDWSPDSDNDDGDMWIAKFDSTGALLWQKTIGKKSMEDMESGMNVLEVAGGDFIVSGGPLQITNIEVPESALINHPDGGYVYGGQSTKLWKISSTGEIRWQKELNLSDPYEFALTCFSPEDTIQWQYRYPLPDSSVVYDLALTPEGDIIAAGLTIHPDNKDMRVMRLKKTGDIVWQKQFSASGRQEGYKVQMSSVGSITIAGFYDTENQRLDGWLCQLTPTGHLDGCASSSLINTYSINEAGSSEITTLSLPYQNPSVRFIDAELEISEAYATSQNLCTGVTKDIDYDGVDDTEESGPDGQDENYDGNNDGLPDRLQKSVASLHTTDGVAYVTLVAGPGSQLQDVFAADNPSPEDQPEDFEFPIGFFDFAITGLEAGGVTSLSLLIPDDMIPETYYKYAQTLEDPDPHWYEFLYDDETGAEIENERIILHFVDGARGDEDLAENGAIKDIGGPAIQKEFTGIVQADYLSDTTRASNYPNPFSVSTTISFLMPESEHVKIEIYDVLGHKIKTLINEMMPPGSHEVVFRPGSLPDGLYFFRIESGAYTETQKMILMR